MGFRFRRSMKIAPGIRLNLSKSGVSASFGPRGLKHTIGPSGSRTTVGLPGTGLSHTTVHKRSRQHPPPGEVGSGSSDNVPTRAASPIIGWIVLAGIVLGVFLAVR